MGWFIRFRRTPPRALLEYAALVSSVEACLRRGVLGTGHPYADSTGQSCLIIQRCACFGVKDGCCAVLSETLNSLLSGISTMPAR